MNCSVLNYQSFQHLGVPVEFVAGQLLRWSDLIKRGIPSEMFLKEERRRLAGVASTFFLAGYPLFAQTFTPTSAPAQNWVSIASSADGTSLAAVASYGYLYLSHNSGGSWNQAVTTLEGREPGRAWQAVASSADGSRLVAAANFSPILISSDYGRSWSSSGPALDWASVACSADGTRMVAVDFEFGGIYTSADAGRSWQLTGAPTNRWRCVTCSADGTRIAAGTDFGADYGKLPAIYISDDFGVSWRQTSAPNEPWQSITSSADGTKLAAAVFGGPIYVSNDAGMNWTAAEVPMLRWTGISSSGHGNKLVATAWDGEIFVSGDFGSSWTAAEAPGAQWQSVTCSFDGSQSFAGIWNVWNDTVSGIYTAQILTPVSNATNASPALEINAVGETVTLTWPEAATALQLQQCSDLAMQSWVDVEAVPRLVEARNHVTLPRQPGNHFFRLVNPTEVTLQGKPGAKLRH